MRKERKKWGTLDGILNETWAMLKRGVGNFRDPFHWPVLGTTGEGGPSLRTVILREFTLPDRVLACHTDGRAAKVREIADSGRASWLFYHPKRKVQLRISGHAVLHSDDRFADERWDATRATSRLNYCTTEPPGTPVDEPSSGLPDLLVNKMPSLLETEKGRDNFVTIRCQIESMDWLLLSLLGNRRARFEWDGEKVSATWLIP